MRLRCALVVLIAGAGCNGERNAGSTAQSAIEGGGASSPANGDGAAGAQSDAGVSACARLRPPAAGVAPRRFSVRVDHAKGDLCLGGLADGAGTLALPIAESSSFARQSHQTAVSFVGAEGSLRGVGSGPYATALSQPSGFVGFVFDPATVDSWSAVHWDSRGSVVARSETQRSFNRVAKNPLGGIVIWAMAPAGIVAYDAGLNLRWRSAVGRGPLPAWPSMPPAGRCCSSMPT